MPSRRSALPKTENLGTGLTELTRFAQGLDRAARLKVGVDLNQGLGPVLLRGVLTVYECTDVVSLDAREAASELGVLIDQGLAKFEDVHGSSMQNWLDSATKCCIYRSLELSHKNPRAQSP